MEFLFTDAQIAVCVKPVGLDSEKELPAAVKAALGGEVYPVHRLDRNVGGVMVFARTAKAAAGLCQVIRQGKVEKEYVALVHGTPPAQGDWTDLLWKDSAANKVYVVRRERRGVKKARLEFTRLTAGETSLVHILLHTGRSHQIRVQFASRGYPLVGDHKYGAKDGCAAPMLYACRLRFPYAGAMQCFTHLPDWAAGVTWRGAEK